MQGNTIPVLIALTVLKNHALQFLKVNLCSVQAGSDNQSENFIQRLFSKRDKEKEREK